MIIYGKGSEELGIKIAEQLQVKAAGVESKIFPDGESYIRFIENLEDRDLIIIQYCYPQQDKKLMELFFMLDTARDLGARRTVAVIPYLPYARQDKRFRPGEVVSNKSVGKLFEAVGTDILVTVDVHSENSLKSFKLQTVNLSAMPLLAEYLKTLKLTKPYVMAPDRGAVTHAQLVSSILNTDYAYFEKHRDRVTGEVVTDYKDIDIGGRDVIILDDIISTGSTIANVARVMRSKTDRKIVAACTHGLIIGEAEKTIRESGVTDIISTDTVPSKFSKVSVSTIISKALRKIM
ncbi:MAG: ribose-phosphate diphosphokinase [Candidatus Bathyarchaeia archaeon]|nr:ribose-phosphate diphosphokinase [Candidatus Bathyarchaeota archaeon]